MRLSVNSLACPEEQLGWPGLPLEVEALLLITGLEGQVGGGDRQPLPTPHWPLQGTCPQCLKRLHFYKLFPGGPS